MSDKKIYIAIAAFFIFIVSNSFFTVALATNNSSVPAVLVEVTRVKLQPFAREITVTGSLRANKGITVRPEIAGRITQKYFTSGQMVKIGTPLIQINKDILTAQLHRDQATLTYNQKTYDRYLALAKKGYVSQADLDSQKSALDTSKATVASDHATLDQSLVKAPFTGRLGLSSIDLGDYVNAGQDIVTLQAIDPIEVEFSVSEVYLSNLFVGEKIKIISDAYPNQVFVGKIYAIDAAINTSSRSVAARAALPNPNNKLLPGAFVQTKLDLTNNSNALIIPQVAAIYDAGQAFVYKVVGNKAYRTRVILGERDRENVVVRSGLNANDLIVTAGQLNIDNGSTVKFAMQVK
jgi:membrane fusion protein, multidrug efflux system